MKRLGKIVRSATPSTGVQYSLFAKNLRAPARGKLRLLF